MNVQERPVPRQAHTAVWDFSDSLIVFGGLGETSVFNDVHVLSLSTGYWSKPACMGQPPALRYGHSAAMVASNLMLVFGGANARVILTSSGSHDAPVDNLEWQETLVQQDLLHELQSSKEGKLHEGTVKLFAAAPFRSAFDD